MVTLGSGLATFQKNQVNYENLTFFSTDMCQKNAAQGGKIAGIPSFQHFTGKVDLGMGRVN